MASDIWEVDHAQELLMFHLAKDDRKDKNPSLGIARIGKKKKKKCDCQLKHCSNFCLKATL